MIIRQNRTKQPTQQKSPETVAIERVEEHPPLAEHQHRIALLRARKQRIVAKQIELEGQHLRDTAPPRRIEGEELLQQASALLALPPEASSPLPQTLRSILHERVVIEKAMELGDRVSRVLENEALTKLRAAKAGEWADLIRAYALAVASVKRAQAARDELFSRIGWSRYGRQPLDLSEFRVIAQRGLTGQYDLDEILGAAIAVGAITKEEID
jgi:hypothetical protein